MNERVQSLLDLITPAHLEMIIEYNASEFDSFWEPHHIEAVDNICEYIEQTYTQRINSSLFRAAAKLREQINNDSK